MPLNDAENINTFETANSKIKPIRIGLIADTHIPADARILPPQVKEAFKDTDLILHAGDIFLPRILDELETIAPVLAARGNDDGEFPQDHRVNDNHVLNINGLNLGLTHRGYYPGLAQHYLDKMMEREFGKFVDIIVYGDTHRAMIERHNGILLVNPGSPTSPNNLLKLGTVALLEIMGNGVKAWIVQLSEFPPPFDRKLIYYRAAGA